MAEVIKIPELAVKKIQSMQARHQQELQAYVQAVTDGMGLDGGNVNLKDMTVTPVKPEEIKKG